MVSATVELKNVGRSGWLQEMFKETHAGTVSLCASCAGQMLPLEGLAFKGWTVPVSVGKLKAPKPWVEPAWMTELTKQANLNAAKKRKATIARKKAEGKP